MVELARIAVFPIKSLDAAYLEACEVLPSGALRDDRRWAIVDRQGQLINGKRTAAVHGIEAKYDMREMTVHLRQRLGDESALGYSLEEDQAGIEEWLTNYFGVECQLIENSVSGFPDDSDKPGPTVVSTASLEEVSRWVPDCTTESMRNRLRTNLEVTADVPFWEDRLFGPSLQRPVRFSLGVVPFYGVGACQRCVVPTRSPENGEVSPGFAKAFSQKREATLPDWAARGQFDHYYRIAVNTRVRDRLPDRRLKVGDELVIE